MTSIRRVVASRSHGTAIGAAVDINPSRRRLVIAGAALALASLLTGCGLFGPKAPAPAAPPPKLVLSLVAAAHLNPDANGRASPVVLRLYELKSAAQFGSADFLLLFDQDRAALASDIVTREEFVMRPGESKSISKPLAPETKAIAVMAAFRDVERARWRAVSMLTPGKDNVVTVVIDGVELRMVPAVP